MNDQRLVVMAIFSESGGCSYVCQSRLSQMRGRVLKTNQMKSTNFSSAPFVFLMQLSFHNGSSVWVCCKNNCNAKAETNTNNDLVKLGLHNHELETIESIQNDSLDTEATVPEPTDRIEFIRTSKGKPAVLYDSFMFYHRKTLNNYTIWKCSHCRNVIRTKGDLL